MIIKIEKYNFAGNLVYSRYFSNMEAITERLRNIAGTLRQYNQNNDRPGYFYRIKQFCNFDTLDLITYELHDYEDLADMTLAITRQTRRNIFGEYLHNQRVYRQYWAYCYGCATWHPRELCISRNGHLFCFRCFSEGLIESVEETRQEDEDLRSFLQPYSRRVTIPREINGSKKLRLGFELEITKGNSKLSESDCHTIIDKMKQERVLPKKDGTVYAEMVSQPLILKDALNKASELVSFLRPYGFTSWNENRAGFHIHVTRCAVKAPENLITFFERYATTLKKVSGRDHWDYCFYDIDYIKGNYLKNRDRYCALNFLNRSTIEFRLWRGSLKIERLAMYLKLTDCLARYSQHLNHWTPTDIAFIVDDPFFDALAIEAGEIDELSLSIARSTLKRGNGRSLIAYLKKHQINSLVD